MKNKKYWLVTAILTLLPMVMGLALWEQLPERMPTHFGIDGAADGWGSKTFAVFGIPVMFLVFQIIIWAVTRLDRQNRGHNEKVLKLVGLIFPAMSIFCAVLMYTRAMEIELDPGSILFSMLGLMFLLMGNWLPKVKQNATLGIKLKWTLYNEENWNKTHRFGGWCWVLGGIVFCVMGFLPDKALLWIMPANILLMVLAPTVYSWRLAKRQQREGTWTESQVSKELNRHPAVKIISLVLVTVILILVGIVMFTGDISYTCTDDALVIEADFWDDLTVAYGTIDSIEYLDRVPDGVREWGWGSARLVMGYCSSDELGSHTRYSYTGCGSCILLRSGDDVLLLTAGDEEATRALYAQLVEKIG